MDHKTQNKNLIFNFDLSEANYEMDAIQQQLLNQYLRYDKKFRMAFHTNFTPQFIQFIKDKVRLNEPLHISTKGLTRSGKSYNMITACIIHQLLYKKDFNINYVNGNAIEFLEKLKEFPENKLKNTIFLIDEEKSMFGIGSYAKKMRIEDVNSIIAVNNVSTIMINPNSWADETAQYGLRSFGRCFKTKTGRFMLYDLQAKGDGLPLGMIYLPIFTSLNLPFIKKLEQDYLKKKQIWVDLEMRSDSDVLGNMKKKLAKEFYEDNQYKLLKTKDEKLTYLGIKLGSNYTRGEVEEIFNITKLLEKGINL